MEKWHVKSIWTGPGMENPAHDRNVIVSAANNPVIYLTCGNPEKKGLNKYIPEQLFAASIATAFMFVFMDTCARENVDIHTYVDESETLFSSMTDEVSALQSLVLKPRVTFSSDLRADEFDDLLGKARRNCILLQACQITITIDAQFFLVKKALQDS